MSGLVLEAGYKEFNHRDKKRKKKSLPLRSLGFCGKRLNKKKKKETVEYFRSKCASTYVICRTIKQGWGIGTGEVVKVAVVGGRERPTEKMLFERVERTSHVASGSRGIAG